MPPHHRPRKSPGAQPLTSQRVRRPTMTYGSPRSLGRERSGRTAAGMPKTVARCPGPNVSRDIGAGPWGPQACADHRRGGQRCGGSHTT